MLMPRDPRTMSQRRSRQPVGGAPDVEPHGEHRGDAPIRGWLAARARRGTEQGCEIGLELIAGGRDSMELFESKIGDWSAGAAELVQHHQRRRELLTFRS